MQLLRFGTTPLDSFAKSFKTKLEPDNMAKRVRSQTKKALRRIDAIISNGSRVNSNILV